jgi:DNA-binding CsgD family transcriptional regulator
LRDLAHAIVEAPLAAQTHRVPYDGLLPDLASATGATHLTSFRPVMGARAWELETKSYWSLGSTPTHDQAQMRRYEDLVASGRPPWAFDPRLPEIAQRNRVFDSGALRPHLQRLRDTGRAVGTKQHSQDTGRAVVCDGPRLLAFVAGFRTHPFEPAEVEAFSTLLPALQRAHRAERVERDRLFWAGVAAAALETLLEPAFVVDGRGVIRHANATGERWLRAHRDGRERVRQIADGHDVAGVRREIPGQRGWIITLRVHPFAPPSQRLELARQRWDLTPKQHEVLGMLVGGATNKAIASALGRSVGSVELHVTAILKRAACTHRSELIARFFALE